MNNTVKPHSITQDFYRIISQLVNFNEVDWETLVNEKEIIKTWAPELVSAFYDTIYELEDTRAVFKEGERPAREETLRDWIDSILAGKPDDSFWEHQWYIALLHIKRGTKNLYMLGIMNRLQQVFLRKALETMEHDKAIKVYGAFLRLSGMVAALIAQCYDAVSETSTSTGLARVGLNQALFTRIKTAQIDKMLADIQNK